MRIFHCQQGSPEWFHLRSGIPTASVFHRLITSQGIRSQSFDNLVERLANERLGIFDQRPETFAMTRGKELEPIARQNFELWFGQEILQVGFVLDDSGLCGCSPDGLLPWIKSGLEIKCPSERVHQLYLKQKRVPPLYVAQVQGSMMVTGYQSWYFMSFHPDHKPLILEVKRNEDFIRKLRELVLEVELKLKDLGLPCPRKKGEI